MVHLCMKLSVLKFWSVREYRVMTSTGAQDYSVEFILENRAVVKTQSLSCRTVVVLQERSPGVAW